MLKEHASLAGVHNEDFDSKAALMRRFSVVFFLPVLMLMFAGGLQREANAADRNNSPFNLKPPGLVPERFAPGIVATDHLEVMGVMSPDMKAFYFVRQIVGEPSKNLLVRYDNGAWQEAIEENHSGAVSFSIDGQTMHLGNRFREKTSAGWSAEKSLGAPFDGFPMMRLTSSAAHTYVFDVRDEIGTLRYSRLVDGVRQQPIAFGTQINTGRYTAHPFIAPDESYLIWDSERPEGYGGSDLYVSFREPDGSWSDAVNLGPDINSEKEDAAGSVSSDGRFLFFHRVDLDQENPENSTANIYWVDARVIHALRP